MDVQSRVLVKSRCRCCKKIVQNGDQTSKEPGRAWLLKDEAGSRRRTSPPQSIICEERHGWSSNPGQVDFACPPSLAPTTGTSCADNGPVD